MNSMVLRWVRSIDFFALTAVLVVLGGGAYAFKDFVVYAFTSNFALNSTIIIALLIGSILIYRQSYYLFLERSLIRWWHEGLTRDTNFSAKRPAYFGNCLSGDLIDRVERMKEDKGSILSSDIVESEVERVAHQFDNGQEMCRFMVGLMVALGLLGTFVGLLETLVQVSDLVGSIGAGMTDSGNAEASMTNVILGLKNPMTAMGTAFSASMFGLIGSIVLGLQMVQLSKSTSKTNRDIRRSSLKVMELLSAGDSKVHDVSALMYEYAQELGRQGRQISSSLAEMTQLSGGVLPILGEIGAHMRESALQMSNLTVLLNATNECMKTIGQLPVAIKESVDVSNMLLKQTSDTKLTLDCIREDQRQLLDIMFGVGGVISDAMNKFDQRFEQANLAVSEGFVRTQLEAKQIAAGLAGIKQLGESLIDVISGGQSALKDGQDSLHAALLEASERLTKESQLMVHSVDRLNNSIGVGNQQSFAYFETTRKQVGESLAQGVRVLEYLALMHGHLAPIPGMTRDLRTMVSELPRRDQALNSFSLAVERFNSAFSRISVPEEKGGETVTDVR